MTLNGLIAIITPVNFIHLLMVCLGIQCPDELRGLPGHLYAFRNKCYLYVPKAETWEDARSNCQRWGTGISGNLVTISDKDTMDAIKNTFTYLKWTYTGVWIGLHVQGRKWKWVTGSYRIVKGYAWDVFWKYSIAWYTM